MKRALLISILLFSFMSVVHSAPTLKVSFNDYTGGLNLKDTPLKVRDNQTQDCQNVQFDQDKTISSRLGYSLYMTLPEAGTILSAIEYKPGTGDKWFVVQIDSNVYATKDAGGNWSTIVTGLKTLYPCEFTIHDNEVWGTNGIDDVFSWNTSSYTAYGFIPKGRFITTHYGQIVLANTGDQRSGVFMNDPYWGSKGILGWVNSQYSFYVRKDDGDEVIALRSHKGGLIVFKNDSIHGILGYGNGMYIEDYTREYGCIDSRTVIEKDTKLLFHSKQGICEFNSGYVKQLDQNVEDFTRNINVFKSSVVHKKRIQDRTADFRLGDSSNTLVDNDYIHTLPSSKFDGQVDKSNRLLGWVRYGASSWNLEAFRSKIVEEYTSKTNLTAGSQHSFSTGDFDYITLPQDSSAYQWTVTNLAINLKRISSDVFQSSVTVKIYNGLNEVLSTDTKWITDLGNGDWYTFFSTYTVTVPRTFKVNAFYEGGGNDGTGVACLIDYMPGSGTQYFTETRSGSLLSTYEAGMQAAGWNLKIKQKISTGTNEQWYYQWTKSYIVEQYSSLALKYQYEMIPSTWGYYTSQKFNAGTSISGWQNFNAVDSGSNLVYQVRYATGSTALDTASWVSITKGNVIAATTSQYWIQWRATLNDENQSVYSVDINWYEGQTTDYQRPCSVLYDNNYITSYSTYGITNTSLLLYDRNEMFTKYANINAGLLIPYDNGLYFSSSNKIYKMNDTYNDNGAAINKYWVSKDFGLLDIDSHITDISVTLKSSGTVIVGWKGNYDTDYTTASITNTGGTKNEVIAVPWDSAQQYWNIKISNNAVGEWFKIISINVYIKPEELYPR